MAVAYQIDITWAPRSPDGRFREFLSTSEALWLAAMTEVQELLASEAASAAPHYTGALAGEMFIGGGGNSIVTSRMATVEPGNPYGPAQDSGYHGGPADPESGKYYSLRDWVLGHGMDESAVFPIAQALDYDGNQYLDKARATVPALVTSEGEKINHLIWTRLGFG